MASFLQLETADYLLLETNDKLILDLEAFKLAASANITASGENTTVQLTAPSGKATSDFDAGRIQDDENPADAVDITADDYTEMEWCITANSETVVHNEIYEFRVVKSGASQASASSGPLSPGTLADDATVGTVAWTNPSDVAASDDTRAFTAFGGISNQPITDSSVRIVKGGTIGSTNKAKATNWPTSDTYATYGSTNDLWGETWTAADINTSTFGTAIAAKNNEGTISHYIKATNFGFDIPTDAIINGILVEVEQIRTGSTDAVNARIDHIRITVYYTFYDGLLNTYTVTPQWTIDTGGGGSVVKDIIGMGFIPFAR